MLPWLIAVTVAAFVALVVVTGRRVGPPGVDPDTLAVARPVLHLTAEDPGPGWTKLGAATTARGLDLSFEADDDPEASAELHLEDAAAGVAFANRVPVRLTDSFETHHAHTGGWIVRASMRGTGAAIGRQVILMMKITGKGPRGPAIENDDDRDPAVGGWIEIASLEVLKVRSAP